MISGDGSMRIGRFVSTPAMRRTSAVTLTESRRGAGSFASRAYAVVKRLSESERAAITARPRRISSLQSAGIASRANIDSRLPAIDLIGARELLISWPMTRISRCHACRSSSRSGRLTSESTSSWCGRPPWRNVVRRTS